MNLHFEGSSWSLVFFALGMALLTLDLVKTVRQLKSGSSKRRVKLWSLFALRVVTVLALCCAINQPFWEKHTESASALLLLDVSDSMDEAVSQALLDEALEFQRQGVELEVLPFAGRVAGASTSISSGQSFRNLKNAWGKLDIGASHFEQGLTSALNEYAGGGTILVISDAQETTGNAQKIAANLSNRATRLYPLIPENAGAQLRSFKISQLYVPFVAPVQKSVEVRVGLLNTTDKPQSGTLEIKHDKRVILTKHVEIAAGGDLGKELLVTAPSDPGIEGIKEITATLKPDDAALQPSSESAFLSGEQREKILMVSGSVEDERYLAEVFKNQSYQLRSEVNEGKFDSLPAFSDFSAVIFNNVALGQLPSSSASAIESYVKSGGSFVMIGGNRSFGLGGYIRSAIEEVLPVEMVPPQTMEKRLNVAVQLLIDKSGSMAFDNKLDFAKEAARETIRNLKDDDFIGIIGFDASPWILVKLDQLARVREQATERVGRLFPNSNTNLMPALQEAQRSLAKVNAGRKHVIVLTDGKLPDGGPVYVEIAKQMRLSGTSLSTVLLGSADEGELLKEMADYGGGAYYQTIDARSLSRIFMNDIKTTTGERTMKEQQDYIVRSGPEGVKSVDIQSFPPVRGYVQTKPKQRAALELVAYADQKAAPLLASWQYGKGKAVAFTSDANGRWSNYWVKWERFVRFWSELVDSIRSKEKESGSVKFDFRESVENGVLNLDVSVYSAEAAQNMSGQIIMPDGSSRQIDFASISRGHFTSSMDQVTAGKYEVRLMSKNRALTPVAFKLSGDLFGEKKGLGFDVALLGRLADASGGKINPDISQVKSGVKKKSERTDLSFIFMSLAALTLLFEIVLREVPRLPVFKRLLKRKEKRLA